MVGINIIINQLLYNCPYPEVTWTKIMWSKLNQMIYYKCQLCLLWGQELIRLKRYLMGYLIYLGLISYKICGFNLFSYLHADWAFFFLMYSFILTYIIFNSTVESGWNFSKSSSRSSLILGQSFSSIKHQQGLLIRSTRYCAGITLIS